jgi:hypothetical protein
MGAADAFGTHHPEHGVEKEPQGCWFYLRPMGVKGAVRVANSLVGSHSNDQVGNDGSVNSYIEGRVVNSKVTALSIGHYVVSSPYWRNGAAAGAVTLGLGTVRVTESVSTAN